MLEKSLEKVHVQCFGILGLFAADPAKFSSKEKVEEKM